MPYALRQITLSACSTETAHPGDESESYLAKIASIRPGGGICTDCAYAVPAMAVPEAKIMNEVPSTATMACLPTMQDMCFIAS